MVKKIPNLKKRSVESSPIVKEVRQAVVTTLEQSFLESSQLLPMQQLVNKVNEWSLKKDASKNLSLMITES